MKICPKCSSPMNDEVAFCTECGAPLADVPAQPEAAAPAPAEANYAVTADEEQELTPAARQSEEQPHQQAGAAALPVLAENSAITLCDDGKYRWVYEMKMLKNPTILFTVWIVLGIAMLVPFAVSLISVLTSGQGAEGVLGTLKLTGISLAIVFVLSIIAYVILAAVKGWKYVVIFEMDDKGLLHAELEDQVKKAQAIGFIEALVGLAAGNMTAAGAGLLSATKTIQKTTFSKVKTVKAHRKRNVIKVNETFSRNQVYFEDQDFDFVWSYITSHCRKAKVQ